jgi:catalase (peroxidase I)
VHGLEDGCGDGFGVGDAEDVAAWSKVMNLDRFDLT